MPGHPGQAGDALAQVAPAEVVDDHEDDVRGERRVRPGALLPGSRSRGAGDEEEGGGAGDHGQKVTARAVEKLHDGPAGLIWRCQNWKLWWLPGVIAPGPVW